MSLMTPRPFVHDAFLYGSDEEYITRTTAFITEGLDAGEPVLVAVPPSRLELIEPNFARVASDELHFVRMDQMGRNPAWIIPAWADFADPFVAEGRPARGIGEPIWSERTPDQLVECERHEALLNVAFADAFGFTLLCPYDTRVLPEVVIDEAHRNHPTVSSVHGAEPSSAYWDAVPDWIGTPLPPAPAHAQVVHFGVDELRMLRQRAAAAGHEVGLTAARCDDAVLAVTEAATNCIRHGGGSGSMAMWIEAGALIFEFRDKGRICDPLAGRRRPSTERFGGRGLWLMHQLCDLVQLRVLPDEQIVRLHLHA
ncbi:MAG: sensor histidine kinase [Acidimicrobiales bacterium]|nr:sensor histidine kinase [Acidimicrobiales bacterium]